MASAGAAGLTRTSAWWARLAFAVIGSSLVAYWVSVPVRGGHYSTLLDGGLVDMIEVAAALLCMASGSGRPRLQPPALVFGAAMLSWAAGDTMLTLEPLGSTNPSGPSLADAFYLGFYPLAYVGAVLFMRQQLRGTPGPSWLDGLIANLGAASLCAAFAFHGIEHLSGVGALGTTVNLAYPIGDLVLFGLAAGGLAVLKGPQKLVWALLAAGMALVAAGDSANLFSRSFGASGPGYFLNAVAWPTAEFLIAAALWAQRDRFALRPLPRPPGLLVPALGAACAQGIVVFSAFHPVNPVALGLSVATLLASGARALCWVGTVRQLNQRSQLQAVTDDLTGLRNRRFMVALLEDYFERRADNGGRGPDLALLFVDLDHFKEVNDCFGHPFGDELLRDLGSRLKACARSGDVVARFGGDEFAVALAGAAARSAMETAQSITTQLEAPFSLQSVEVRIGASVGIAMASTASGPSELMWCADVAMYRAKQAGTPFAIYGEIAESAHAVQLVEQLRDAVSSDQLVLYYQPLVDLKTRVVRGAEALLRWAHPELGLVPPLEFLPLAEEAGLMPLVTDWVLSTALRQAAMWRAQGHELSVSVNISPASLLEEGFVAMVEDGLLRNGLPPHALVIEITENAVIRDLAQARAAIERLAELGLVVSIDDFGAGATSLAYLSKFAGLRELKLDRSFVVRLCSADSRELDLARATIELGHAMGLRVVAEGIEDAETLELLAGLDCDLAQGYHISRPRPAGELNLRQLAVQGAPS